MPRVILFRHAKSDWFSDAQTDFDRPLNSRGLKAAPVMGKYLKNWITSDMQVICSPAARTVQTLQLASAEWPQLKHHFVSTLYEATEANITNTIKSYMPNDVMVIAHNPGLECLAYSLCTSHISHFMQNRFITAAIAVFSFDGRFEDVVEKGSAELLDFKHPKEILTQSTNFSAETE